MGNCIGSNQSNERLSMKSSEKTLKMKESNPRKCQSDPLQDVSFKSLSPENGEIVTRLYRPHCRIPILKERHHHGTSEKSIRGYKSVIVDGPASSRIPVTSPNSEFRNSVSTLTHEDCSNHGKFTESGFVSDLSVTASTYSQLNGETKALSAADHEVPHAAVTRNHRSTNKQSSCSTSNQSTDNAVSVTQSALKPGAIPPGAVPMRSSTMSTKYYHPACTVDGKFRRPQSLSTESEILINKSLSKRSSDASEMLSPPAAQHEHHTFMQDVSSLKLMLHKLKRYLTQDGDERLPDSESSGLFRACPPPLVDISSMAREELEQRYEALLEQNSHLERLLQSREKVIVQMLGERRVSEKLLHSGLGDTRVSDHLPWGPQEQNPPHQADSALYQWTHLKMP